ncbi:MAG: class I SAM-dependent methyltransferase [Raoultibacter sp.]
MNAETVEALRTINNDFYQNQCDSFSETRKAPWAGWEKCLAAVTANNPAAWQDFSVLDVACGNLRFEDFLTSACEGATITFYAVDNCNGLVPPTPSVDYQNFDVMAAACRGESITDQLSAPVCDLCVSFGFFHHVPTAAYREKILASLIKQTRPGGYVAVSLWQFLNSAEMAEKARITDECARKELGLPALDANDYLLGWKNLPGQYRYCHSFSETEIDRLIAAVTNHATLVSRFSADGRTGNLNTYVVLRVG